MEYVFEKNEKANKVLEGAGSSLIGSSLKRLYWANDRNEKHI